MTTEENTTGQVWISAIWKAADSPMYTGKWDKPGLSGRQPAFLHVS